MNPVINPSICKIIEQIEYTGEYKKKKKNASREFSYEEGNLRNDAKIRTLKLAHGNIIMYIITRAM